MFVIIIIYIKFNNLIMKFDIKLIYTSSWNLLLLHNKENSSPP